VNARGIWNERPCDAAKEAAARARVARVGGFRADTQVLDLAIPLDQG
jgi:hypothetical protein